MDLLGDSSTICKTLL